MTIEALLTAIRAFEERVEADPVQVVLFGDGSGEVMAPPDSEFEDGDTFESVYSFDSIKELKGYLESGELPRGTD